MSKGKKSSPLDRHPLAVQYRPASAIIPDPKNPRFHDEKQIKKIAESIRTFGFIVPVLVDAGRKIIAGHGRLEAAVLLGLKEVPTITLEHLSPEQVRAFMIADNHLTEIGTWDNRLLGEQLRALAEAQVDFSMEVTGFETAEIDSYIEGLEEAHDGDDPADEVPASGPAVARSGDLWLLDKHRVLCGDSLKADSFAKLLEGKKAAVVVTDPPFNTRVDRYICNFGKTKFREFEMASGEMTPQEFTGFLTKAFRNLANASVPGALHYIAIDWRHLPELLAAGKDAYTEFKALCVWVKNSAGQGSLYRSQHELFAIFKSGKAPHRNNIQLGKYGRYRTNVWEYARVNGAAGSSDEEGLGKMHPTIKPVQLVADVLMDSTTRGDTVLDAFLGSGTTVIAAERTGRICYGLEIDPAYVDVIIRRWETFTGKSAVHAKSKKSFRELEEVASAKKK